MPGLGRGHMWPGRCPGHPRTQRQEVNAMYRPFQWRLCGSMGTMARAVFMGGRDNGPAMTKVQISVLAPVRQNWTTKSRNAPHVAKRTGSSGRPDRVRAATAADRDIRRFHAQARHAHDRLLLRDALRQCSAHSDARQRRGAETFHAASAVRGQVRGRWESHHSSEPGGCRRPAPRHRCRCRSCRCCRPGRGHR